MYKGKTVCVIVPAHNEATQIGRVIQTMPGFVDRIIIVDDCSMDKTVEIVASYKEKNEKLFLVQHEKNLGVGGAMVTGYKFARDQDFDIAVRMDGDGQMAPDEMVNLIEPLLDDDVDFSKGNRLLTGEAYKKIPKVRYFGNAFLSLLTKVASGYWNIADSQCGYTAINKKGLRSIEWDKMYKQYGQPNDLLVRLNVNNLRVKDVPVEPLYGIGEKSGIRIKKVVFTISFMLLKMFLWRMKEKYVIRDFHPLVFFYSLGGIFGLLTTILTVRMFFFWFVYGHIPSINALASMFSFMSTSLFTLFAMWFDMEANNHLRVR